MTTTYTCIFIGRWWRMSDYIRRVLIGDVSNLPAKESNVVRIFTSSTFTGKILPKLLPDSEQKPRLLFWGYVIINIILFDKARYWCIARFQCHAIQNRSKSKSKLFNRLSPESGKWTEVNIQRFAKIQARGIFRIRDIRRNVLPKFIEICMETPCWCPPGWAPTLRTETNRNICYWVLLQKREVILRETHKH